MVFPLESTIFKTDKKYIEYRILGLGRTTDDYILDFSG